MMFLPFFIKQSAFLRAKFIQFAQGEGKITIHKNLTSLEASEMAQ